MFSLFYVFPACEVTCLLIHLRFWEADRKAAPAQKTGKEGRSSKNLIETKKVPVLDDPYFLVFYAGAAFRLPSPKRTRMSRQRKTQERKVDQHFLN